MSGLELDGAGTPAPPLVRPAFKRLYGEIVRRLAWLATFLAVLCAVWNASLVLQEPARFASQFDVVADWSGYPGLTNAAKTQVIENISDWTEVAVRELRILEGGRLSDDGLEVDVSVVDPSALRVVFSGSSVEQAGSYQSLVKRELDRQRALPSPEYQWPPLSYVDGGGAVPVSRQWLARVIWPAVQTGLGSMALFALIGFWLAAYRYRRPTPPPLVGTESLPATASLRQSLVRGLWVPLLVAAVVFLVRSQVVLHQPPSWVSLATIQFGQGGMQSVLPATQRTDSLIVAWLDATTRRAGLLQKAAVRARNLDADLPQDDSLFVSWGPCIGGREVTIVGFSGQRNLCLPFVDAYLDEFRIWFDEQAALGTFADVDLRVVGRPSFPVQEKIPWIETSIWWAAWSAAGSFSLMLLVLGWRKRRKTLV